jgi:hypothetical protein
MAARLTLPRRTAVLALALGLLSAGLSAAPAAVQAAAQPAERADFRGEPASVETRGFADWVTASADNGGLPFVIIDKVRARIFVFYPDGRLRGAAAALLGLARGDDSVPGIGDRPLASIRPQERTTPAGRFVASLGADLGAKDVVWVDYADAISLHRVITSKPKERRLQRLATPSAADNRISYGCINVPARFYDAVVHPAFSGTNGIVYILPEVRSLASVFPAYRAPPSGVSPQQSSH